MKAGSARVAVMRREAILKLFLNAAPTNFRRGFLPLSFVCRRCLRAFGTTAASLAGHNKWSKTKHIKAATDKKKMAERASFIKVITAYSRMHEEDIRVNPQLAQVISSATKGSYTVSIPHRMDNAQEFCARQTVSQSLSYDKANVPKSLIEAAIARGQSRSAIGTQLESLTIEIMLPPKIGLIANVETDKKTRTIQGLRQVMKANGGVIGSTSFLFCRRGRLIFRSVPSGPKLLDVLEGASDLDGVQDIEERDSRFVVWADPTSLITITQLLSDKFGLEMLESDIVWAPKEETMVDVESQDSVESLDALLTSIRKHPEVKAVFANIRQGTASDDVWCKVMRHIDN